MPGEAYPEEFQPGDPQGAYPGGVPGRGEVDLRDYGLVHACEAAEEVDNGKALPAVPYDEVAEEDVVDGVDGGNEQELGRVVEDIGGAPAEDLGVEDADG